MQRGLRAPATSHEFDGDDDNPLALSGTCFPQPASVELHLGPDVIDDGTVRVSRQQLPQKRGLGESEG